MRYETIQAANMKQAIIRIHEAFGADAMICRTRKTVGGIEILVGIQEVEEVEEEVATDLDDLISEKLRQLVESPVVNQPVKPVVKQRKFRRSLKVLRVLNPLRPLRVLRVLNPLRPLRVLRVLSPIRPLKAVGGKVKWIFSIRKRRQLRKELRTATPYNISDVTSRFEMKMFRRKQKQTVNAFVGPSGSGKTTTLIKLVIQSLLNYTADEIGIISTNVDDVYIDSKLKRFALLYHIDYKQANTAKELSAAIKSMKDKKLVLIDTHGISQRDFGAVSKTRYMLEKAAGKISVYLVMPASYQPEVIGDCIKYYAFKSLQGCVLTKADEIVNLDPVLEIFALADIQVTYVCNGEDLDKDIYTMKQDENLLEFSLDKYSEIQIPQFNNQSANW